MFKLWAYSNIQKQYVCVDHGSIVNMIANMIVYQDAYVTNNIGVKLLSHKAPSV